MRVNMSKITVAQQVINTLKELGVKHVFGVPSGGWVDYMEAMRTTDGIDFVLRDLGEECVDDVVRDVGL